MKLPIQAQPVLRNVNTAKISVASGITAGNGTQGGMHSGKTRCGLDQLGNAVQKCKSKYCAPTNAKGDGAWFCGDGGVRVGHCIVKANNWYAGGCKGTFDANIDIPGLMVGAFQFYNDPGIYYSNGSGHVCLYDTPENFVRLNGGEHRTYIRGRLEDYGVKYDGVCKG